ncbi:MAG: methyltransferase domain-containing protein [Rhodobacteraceae bacterium]|nr:methyltransferase domain-containing protein [Paracoccaceae bacterium]
MWDKRYSGKAFAYGTTPNDFLRAQAHNLPLGDVLSLGEGEGRNAVFLAGLGHKVSALDGSQVGLEKAQAFAKDQGVEIKTIHADLANYQIEENRWDVIVSIFCHLPPDIRRKTHRQIAAALRPGGCLILEAYTPQQLEYKTGGPPTAAMMMDLESLRAELGALEFEFAQEGIRDVQEGAFHSGTGATVQLVARKGEAG